MARMQQVGKGKSATGKDYSASLLFPVVLAAVHRDEVLSMSSLNSLLEPALV